MTSESTGELREANVLLAMLLRDPVSFDVLDANSDDVLEAVQAHASELALGPAISLRTDEPTILLRFDVRATSPADVYRQVGEVLATVEEHTDLIFARSHSDVEVLDPVGGSTPVTC